jgi:hypothetical protein
MPLSVSSEVDLPTVTGLREMSQVKLEKHHKAWLIEAVNACMDHIDLLESNEDSNEVGNDSKVRSELRELKADVYVNAVSVQVITQDMQDFMDRPDTRWDAIHKLAAEQKATPQRQPRLRTPLLSRQTSRQTPLTPLLSGRTAPLAPRRATRPSLPSGSSWRGPRTCGAYHLLLR